MEPPPKSKLAARKETMWVRINSTANDRTKQQKRTRVVQKDILGVVWWL